MRLLIALVGLMLAGCGHTVLLSDGTNQCVYQTKHEIDTEAVRELSTIIVDASGQMMRAKPISSHQKQAATPMACEGSICMELTPDGCRAVVTK